ncbi:MAG: cytochrome C oxidase subunit II [Chloroflexi bacterium]|nr:MAG: cytochrome C oxidase subunit II [Chloroflexota bacterium]
MVNRTSTLVAPRGRWWTPLGRDERMWFAVVSVWAVAMFVMMMFVWPAIGNEQTTIESYRVSEQEFAALTQAFIDQHATGENIGGIPVVAPPPGDVYLLSQRFQFRPIITLQKGQTYRFLLSSLDVQHGFSLQPDNVNFQVLPGYVSAIELTPEEAGEYTLVCNEYCGLGHHLMIGRIIVTE